MKLGAKFASMAAFIGSKCVFHALAGGNTQGPAGPKAEALIVRALPTTHGGRNASIGSPRSKV